MLRREKPIDDPMQNCIHCHNFITRELTVTNAQPKDKALQWICVRKKLKREGRVQVYYCKFNLLPKDYYVSIQTANQLFKPNCKSYK
jgi:hypothetical protein